MLLTIYKSASHALINGGNVLGDLSLPRELFRVHGEDQGSGAIPLSVHGETTI